LTARKACLLTVRYRTDKDWHPATCMDLCARLLAAAGRGSAPGLHCLLFEALLADGARSPSVEVVGSVTWARPEGLSYQTGVHFSEGLNAIGEVVNAII
jgi:hypothetical protein